MCCTVYGANEIFSLYVIFILLSSSLYSLMLIIFTFLYEDLIGTVIKNVTKLLDFEKSELNSKKQILNYRFAF